MTDISLDKDELREFVDLMHATAREMRQIRRAQATGYAQADGNPTAAYRNGVKMTLGSVNYAHSGRLAGEIIADRIAETLEFVQSVEEGTQAMGDFVDRVLTELGAEDSIAATELARIGNDFLPPMRRRGRPSDSDTEGV